METELTRVSTRCDPGGSGARPETRERPDGGGGLGPKLVEQLAARWGCERRHGGYRVWAQLPLPA